MRLWSIHPKYLDTKGLVALWREALLAKAVLENKTNGYKYHPQLIRFKALKNPVSGINQYIEEIYSEAHYRGFKFNRNKFTTVNEKSTIEVTIGQLEYEFDHLLQKLKNRSPEKFHLISGKKKNIKLHPMFRKVEGTIEDWEKVD